MHIQHLIYSILIILISSLSHYTLADDDHIKARQLYESGQILSLESILQRVRKNYPAKVLEVELERKGDIIVYEIEMLYNNGIVKEVYIDARTGDILFSKEDD